MPLSVQLDRDRCQGHGRCYALAPNVFGADDDGYGFVKADGLSAEFESEARSAVMNCPEDAITLVDARCGDEREERK